MVVSPEGKRIRTFRRSWITACIKAGFGKRITDAHGKLVKAVVDRIPHDFRRTAVRNLERAGAARSAAMKMGGHKTQSIYSRYAIADEGMLKDAALNLARLHDSTIAAKSFHWRSRKVLESRRERWSLVERAEFVTAWFF